MPQELFLTVSCGRCSRILVNAPHGEDNFPSTLFHYSFNLSSEIYGSDSPTDFTGINYLTKTTGV
jgi:hypothetical protein